MFIKNHTSIAFRYVCFILILILAMPSVSAEAKSKKKKENIWNTPVPYDVIQSADGYKRSQYNVMAGTTIRLKSLNKKVDKWGVWCPNLARTGAWFDSQSYRYTKNILYAMTEGGMDYTFNEGSYDSFGKFNSHVFHVRTSIFSRDFHTEEGLSFSIYDGIWPELNVKPVKFTSSNSSRLTISTDGTITAIKGGTKKITVSALCDNGKTYKCKVKIDKRPKKTLTVYEPDENHWGLIHQNEKKYEWIPEMTVDHPKMEELEDILYEAVKHGTVNIVLTNVKEKIDRNVFYNTYRNIIPSLDQIDITSNELTNDYIIHIDYYCGTMVGFKYALRNFSLEKMVDLEHAYHNSITDISIDEVLEVEEKAVSIVQKVISLANNDEEAIRFTFDYIYDNSEYGYYGDSIEYLCEDGYSCITMSKRDTDITHDARGSLIYHVGVCSSFADAYSLCLTMLGIQNYKCGNVDGGHQWNKLLLSGEWLNIDLSTCKDIDGLSAYGINSYKYRCDGDIHNRFLYLVSDVWMNCTFGSNSNILLNPFIYKEHLSM